MKARLPIKSDSSAFPSMDPLNTHHVAYFIAVFSDMTFLAVIYKTLFKNNQLTRVSKMIDLAVTNTVSVGVWNRLIFISGYQRQFRPMAELHCTIVK